MPGSVDRRVPRPHHPLRTRFSRAAVPYWLAVAAAAVTTTLLVAALVGRAAAAEARYGRTRPVVVATRALAPGDPVGAGSVEVARRPVALVPDGAMTAVPTDRSGTGGRVAVADIAEGEVVIDARVSGGGGEGGAALVPPGHRALAVPLLVPGLPLRPGDRVDVLVTAGGGDAGGLPAGGSPTGAAGVVASDAVVIAVGEQSVTVAVDADDAVEVAVALTSGTVAVALAGPPG